MKNSRMIDHKTSTLDYIFNFFVDIKHWLYALGIYLNLDVDVAKVLTLLMFIDTFFGGVKAVRTGEKFSFKVLYIGLMVKFCFLILPMVVALVGKGLSFDLHWMVIGVMWLLIVSEGISIIESLISIKTKKKIKKFDAISTILNLLKDSLKAIFNAIVFKIKSIAENVDTGLNQKENQ